MSERLIEPLEPGLWFAEIDYLYARRVQSSDEELGTVFRKAFYLVQLAPAPLKALMPTDLQESAVEAFLDCGAYGNVALALCGAPLGVTLRREVGCRATEATVFIPGAASEGTDRDNDLARALLGAWCRVLLLLRDSSATAYLPGLTDNARAAKADSISSVH